MAARNVAVGGRWTPMRVAGVDVADAGARDEQRAPVTGEHEALGEPLELVSQRASGRAERQRRRVQRVSQQGGDVLGAALVPVRDAVHVEPGAAARATRREARPGRKPWSRGGSGGRTSASPSRPGSLRAGAGPRSPARARAEPPHADDGLPGIGREGELGDGLRPAGACRLRERQHLARRPVHLLLGDEAEEVNVHLLPSSSSSVADHAASSMHWTCSFVGTTSRLGASACNTAMVAESRCTRSWG